MLQPSPSDASTVIYLRDCFVRPGEPALVSLFDRAYLLGDAIFETLRVYGHEPFKLTEHLQRLYGAAALLGISIDELEIEQVARAACRRSTAAQATLRITLSRGEGPPSLDPSVIVGPLRGYSAAAYRLGITTQVVKTRRIPASCFGGAIKCTHYLPAVLARRELAANGRSEGIQLTVAGGTASNIFAVFGRELVTPWLESGCLPGITRATMIELALALGLCVHERRVELSELYQADELFFTNSLMECLPIAAIGDHALNHVPGPNTRNVSAAYRALVQAQTGHELHGAMTCQLRSIGNVHEDIRLHPAG